MADPVTIAVIAAGAGGALGAGASIMAGREQSMASKFEAQQLTQQAGQIKTAAAQAETQRREDLSSSLQTIMAIRAGRGVGEGSETGMAIYDQIVTKEESNIRTEKLNILTQADTARMQAQLARRRAKTSMIAGYIGAGEEIAGAAFKGASAAA
jgi:hypothetical protein